MIASLRGVLAECYADHIVIDVGGVGYRAFVSQNTMRALPAIGQETVLRIHTHLREDALLLFGFAGAAEKDAFMILTGVTGVGPKLALAVLSDLTPEQLSRVVYTQDVKSLTKVSGVGKKTAERIILELRDKMKLVDTAQESMVANMASETLSGPEVDATLALVALGYARVDAELAVQWAASLSENDSLNVSALVRTALRRLAPSA